jgi:catechol 2,3-dioxygenase-like lactoylglutathione lyase family enzyme
VAKRKARKSARSKAKTAPAKRAAAKPARAKSQDASGLRVASIAPSFTVNDLEKSLAWYRDVLGLKMGDRWEHDGVLTGAELSAGGTTFMITQDDWKLGRDRVKGAGFRLFCTTSQDVDQLAAGIKARGGTLASEPRDEWGMRAFAIVDPDGFKITIAKALKR